MPIPSSDFLLEHLYRPATASEKPPAVLFLLHGYGSNKEDLFSFASYLPTQFAVIALNAAIALPFGGYAWYDLQFTTNMERLSNYEQANESLNQIQQNIIHFCNHYQLDSQRVSCLGFSQGAVLCWALGLDQPNLVHQTLGLSGVIDPELLKKPISTYRNIIAFASHGKEDATIPIHYARETVGLLADNNPEVLFKEYPVGHTIAQDNFSDLIRWLVR